MPKKLHRKLEKQARKKRLKGKRRDAYIYGTMQKKGWRPKKKPKKK